MAREPKEVGPRKRREERRRKRLDLTKNNILKLDSAKYINTIHLNFTN